MIVLDTEVDSLSGLAFAPDGRELAVVGSAGSGRFAVPDGRKLAPLPNGYYGRLWYNGNRPFAHGPGFAALTPDGTAFDPQSPEQQTVIAVSADGRTIVTAANSIRQVPRARRRRRAGATGDVMATVNVCTYRRLDRTADGWAERWDAEATEYHADVATLSADGRWLATGRRYGGAAWVWDADTGAMLHQLRDAMVIGGQFAGDRLLAYTRAGLSVWDANDWAGEPLYIYGGRHERLDDLAVHPDGRRAFLTNFARTVLVVDLQTGTVQTTMDWGVPLLSKVAVSADGTLAAAANHGGQVVLWDLDP